MHSLFFTAAKKWMQCLAFVTALTFLTPLAHLDAKKSKKGKGLKKEQIDLETRLSPYVLETKQISIPEYKHGFNPSIVPWKGGWLIAFRVIKDSAKHGWRSYVALVRTDQAFNPIGATQLLNTRSMSPEDLPNSSDPRLIWVDDTLYVLYADTLSPNGGNHATVRMWIGRLTESNGQFFLHNPEKLSSFPKEQPLLAEKNWIPFVYQHQLLLAYHVSPHRIFRPLLDGSGICEELCSTQVYTGWKWGEPRGGTPALKVGNGYLAFFHSSIPMKTVHNNSQCLHYFMGAYRFAAEPPFPITHMSSTPIIGKGFYHGKQYSPYWQPVQAVFPAGFVVVGNQVYVSYGRADHEIWIARIDLPGLMNSLEPVYSK